MFMMRTMMMMTSHEEQNENGYEGGKRENCSNRNNTHVADTVTIRHVQVKAAEMMEVQAGSSLVTDRERERRTRNMEF